MSDPITRTVFHENDCCEPCEAALEVRQVSVPWCDTHDAQWDEPEDGEPNRCLWSHVVYDLDCRLRDPHAPNAVWKDTIEP